MNWYRSRAVDRRPSPRSAFIACQMAGHAGDRWRPCRRLEGGSFSYRHRPRRPLRLRPTAVQDRKVDLHRLTRQHSRRPCGDTRFAASFNATPGPRCDAEAVPLRCLIVDDNASFLHAAATLLERQGITVAGLAANGSDALRRARELQPDVVLVDIVL